MEVEFGEHSLVYMSRRMSRRQAEQDEGSGAHFQDVESIEAGYPKKASRVNVGGFSGKLMKLA